MGISNSAVSPPPAVTAQAIDAELSKGVKWLRFPASIEREYDHETGPRKVRQLTMSALVGIILYNLFLIADAMLMSDVFRLAVILRLLIVTPISMLIYIILQESRVARLRNLLASLNLVLCFAATAWLLVMSADPDKVIYNQGALLLIFYGCLIQRIEFWYSVATVIACNLLFGMSVFLQGLASPQVIFSIEITIVTGSIFILYVAYTMEREQRLLYLLTLRERVRATEMEDISNLDAMTGLFNRRALDAHFSRLEAEMPGWQDHHAVIILDIDHFKIYNDRLGHLAGDDCLKAVARLLRETLKEDGGYAFRYGGEEFLLLVREKDLGAATALADRIRASLEAQAIPHPRSETGAVVTASFGVSRAEHPDAKPDEIISRADRALYAAKNHGRNRVWPPVHARPAVVADHAVARMSAQS